MGNQEENLKRKSLPKINIIKENSTPEVVLNGELKQNDKPKMGDKIAKDINGNIKENAFFDKMENQKLHGYNKITEGCGEKIQLENPNKKELLVIVFNCLIGGGVVKINDGDSFNIWQWCR